MAVGSCQGLTVKGLVVDLEVTGSGGLPLFNALPHVSSMCRSPTCLSCIHNDVEQATQYLNPAVRPIHRGQTVLHRTVRSDWNNPQNFCRVCLVVEPYMHMYGACVYYGISLSTYLRPGLSIQ